MKLKKKILKMFNKFNFKIRIFLEKGQTELKFLNEI